MMEKSTQRGQQRQEGILVWDPEGVVIAWPDGLARRFSWTRLRQLSLSEEVGGQSIQQPPVALAQPGIGLS